jgi:hypothetical protein
MHIVNLERNMSLSEGVIVKIHANNKAEVQIQEQNSGIIGAPDLNVCHSPSPGSVLVTLALNQAQALLGDRVCLEQPSRAIMKNILALILIPFLGLFAGILISTTLYHAKHLSIFSAIFISVFSFLISLGLGWFLYKKVLKPSVPVIIKIIETGEKS